MSETQQCPNCGMANEVGRSLCANCQTPLTAYAGQLTGETSRGKLAEQVSQLESRPPVVVGMALFDVLLALAFPLARVVGAFATRAQTNAAGTNYMASAFGVIGPIFQAVVLIPIAVALFVLAWAIWAQRGWAWTVNAITLGAFAVLTIFKFPSAPILAFVYVGLACGFAYFWFQPRTKAWFGL